MCRFVCDDLDGRFARMLKQNSTLGVVLDMVTDRYVVEICFPPVWIPPA